MWKWEVMVLSDKRGKRNTSSLENEQMKTGPLNGKDGVNEKNMY
jgi:hypothetical protein